MSVIKEKLSDEMNAGILLEICRRVRNPETFVAEIIVEALRKLTYRNLPHIDYEVPDSGLDASEVPPIQIFTLLSQCLDVLNDSPNDSDAYRKITKESLSEFFEDAARRFMYDLSNFIYNEMSYLETEQAKGQDEGQDKDYRRDEDKEGREDKDEQDYQDYKNNRDDDDFKETKDDLPF
jgi:hypothetical protein